MVRRAHWGGRLREFVHPADGSPAIERGGAHDEAVRAEASGIAVDEQGRARQGQLVGRPVGAADATRPLHLPLLRAGCDGSGACCGSYHHVPLTPEDAARIRALMKGRWDGPVPLDEVFYDAFEGVSPTPLNVVHVDGSCAFLEAGGGCAVHRIGGARAKPLGCRAFPAVLVACGDEWHASLRPECACFVRHCETGRLLHEDPEPWAALRASFVRVWEVPERIWIDDGEHIARDEYVAWMRATVADLATTGDVDVTLAKATARLGLPDVQPTEPGEWLDELRAHLRAELDDLPRTHAPMSPYRLTIEWGAGVEPAFAPRPREAAAVATAVLHGHLLLEQRVLGEALTELRRVLWLGQATTPPDDGRIEPLTGWVFLWRNVFPKGGGR